MLPTLYEIAAEYRQDLEKLSQLDLPEEVVRDTIESMSGALEEKAKNIGFLIRHLEAVEHGIQEAEAQMLRRRRALKKRIDELHDYTLGVMMQNGIHKIETPYFTLSQAKNPPSVDVYEQSLIPQEYFTHPEPPPPVLNKRAIMDAMKAGEEVPGCRIKQKVRLEIK